MGCVTEITSLSTVCSSLIHQSIFAAYIYLHMYFTVTVVFLLFQIFKSSFFNLYFHELNETICLVTSKSISHFISMAYFERTMFFSLVVNVPKVFFDSVPYFLFCNSYAASLSILWFWSICLFVWYSHSLCYFNGYMGHIHPHSSEG